MSINSNMKNIMKKIIISLFALTFLLVGQGVFASSIWNTGAQGPECPDINIANVSTTTGYGSPCWTLTNVSASPGNTIAVKVYYHNTSNSAATSTHIKIIPPSGSSTYQSFTGQILSPQGNLYTSGVTANISTAQTVTFSSAVWYIRDANGNLYSTPLLNGQSGSEAIGPNGLDIGNVAPGWPSQGAVVVNFLIGNSTPPQNCSITNFTANPNSITSGSSSTLTWNTNNCTSASISTIGSVNVNGNQTVSPTYSTTYVLTAYGSNGTPVSQSQTVSVNQLQNCSITNFTANPNSITSGSSSTLTWNTNNCTSASISTIGSVNVNGNQTVSPTYSTTYVLTAYGSNGTPVSQSQTVSVNQLQNCSITNFTANPNSITSGGSSTLTWNTANCTSVTISNLGYNVPTSGVQVIYPTVTTSYTLTATGSNGLTQIQTVTVSVNTYQNTCSITNFTANGSSSTTIQSGNAVNLVWNTTGNCSVTITGPNFNSSLPSGSQTIYPTYSGTYVLSTYGTYSGTQSQSVYVNVTNYQQYNNCAISYFSASPTSINYGGLSTLSWSTSNCTSVSITNIGSVNMYGSQYVYPTYTTTYTLTAYGTNGGAPSQAVTINVNNYVPTPTPIYNTCAVTSVATNITRNGATLNGIVNNTSSYGASTYFEYGPTVSLGFQTNPRSSNGNTSFSEIVTGLSSNTIYYYRLVSNCGTGTGRGSIEIFQTTGNQINTNTNTTTIIRQGTTVIGTESPIMLKIENRYQSIKVGDTVDYTVTYQNIGTKTLTHPVLQVVLPRGIAFLNSSRGTYQSDTYTLTVPLEDLVPNIVGTVYLEGRVDSIDNNNAQIVTTAILVYTTPKGAQENAMAYVLNSPTGGSSLVGAAIFGGGILPRTMLGWLFLFVIVLALVLIVRKLREDSLYQKSLQRVDANHIQNLPVH